VTRSDRGAPLRDCGWDEPFREGAADLTELSAPPKKAATFCQKLFFAGALDPARSSRWSNRRRDPPRRWRREFLPVDWDFIIIFAFKPVTFWAERIEGCTVQGARTPKGPVNQLKSSLRSRRKLRLVGPGNEPVHLRYPWPPTSLNGQAGRHHIPKLEIAGRRHALSFPVLGTLFPNSMLLQASNRLGAVDSLLHGSLRKAFVRDQVS